MRPMPAWVHRHHQQNRPRCLPVRKMVLVEVTQLKRTQRSCSTHRGWWPRGCLHPCNASVPHALCPRPCTTACTASGSHYASSLPQLPAASRSFLQLQKSFVSFFAMMRFH